MCKSIEDCRKCENHGFCKREQYFELIDSIEKKKEKAQDEAIAHLDRIGY